MVPAPITRLVLEAWRDRQRRPAEPALAAAHEAAKSAAVAAVHAKQFRKIAEKKAASVGDLF